MKTIEQLVDLNYNHIKTEDCIDRIVTYVKLNQTITSRRVHFIKKITKVASHILKEKPAALCGLTERLYQYTLTGTMKIESGECDNMSQECKDKLYGHLHNYLGVFAFEEFKRTGDLTWAQTAHAKFIQSSNLQEATEPMYSSGRMRDAAEVARETYERTKDLPWLVQRYENMVGAAQLAEADFERSTHDLEKKSWNLTRIYLGISSCANLLAQKTMLSSWKAKKHNATVRAARTIEQYDAAEGAKYYLEAATYAKQEGNATNNAKWFKAALNCYESFMRLTTEKKNETRRYKRIAAEIAHRNELDFLAYQSKDAEWEE